MIKTQIKPNKVELKPLSSDQISVICYELYLMQRAGINLEESLSILLDDMEQGNEKNALYEIYKEVSYGEHFSHALKSVGLFPDYMVRMVEIGNASGKMEDVLLALSEYYRKDAQMNSAIRKAVTYPMGMAFLIALVFLVLISRVLPVFDQVFSQLGIVLSPLAKSLMAFGVASKHIATAMSIMLVALSIFGLYAMKFRNGGELISAIGKKFFSKSKVNNTIQRSHFASVMSLMLSSGLHIDESMERAEKLLKDTSFVQRIRQCNEYTHQGSSYTAAATKSGLFTGMQGGILSSGFSSGMPDKAMTEIAERCQQEADALLSSMLGKFEYSMVIILCTSVGLVLLSVMLPLLGVLSGIGGM